MRIKKVFLAVVTLVFLFSLFGGFLLDDLHVDPFFGFRGKWSAAVQRTIVCDAGEIGANAVKYQMIAGPKEPMVEVSLLRDGKRVFRLGGNHTTYIGFKDLDGDGVKEVLARTQSQYGSNGIWRFDAGEWRPFGKNSIGNLYFILASILIYAPALGAASFIAIVVLVSHMSKGKA